MSDGKVQWLYTYMKYTSYYFTETASTKSLNITFDKTGVVEDYTYSESKQ